MAFLTRSIGRLTTPISGTARLVLAVSTVAVFVATQLSVAQPALAQTPPVSQSVRFSTSPSAASGTLAASSAITATAKRKRDVRLTRGFYVDNRMPAAQASKQDSRFRILGRTAQALWATDYYSPKEVRVAFRDYVTRAAKAKKTPVIAVYAIPGRDCGGHSSGGFTAKTYKKWIKQLSLGIKGSKSIVILEPDAVPFLGDCSGQGNRASLLRYAAKTLKQAGAWVYIDAGHSGWHSASTIAKRLTKSGIKYARGFTLNVGNYRWTKTEVVYGRKIVAALKKRGYAGKKYLVETARNGAGPSADGNDVCNPPHARIGAKPRMVTKGALDGYVWIKHPGESDGHCYGGPSSGAWWPEGALKIIGK